MTVEHGRGGGHEDPGAQIMDREAVDQTVKEALGS
jgi:hypothetical protein